MKSKIIILGFLAMLAVAASAQDRKITGMLIDRDSKQPVEQATIQLLKNDSSFVGGVLSDELGIFTVKAPKNGKYLLRITSLGYQTLLKHIVIEDKKDLEMGKIDMQTDAVLLKETEVIAQARKVVMKEDTFVYNSSAYRTPEGSTIEELVKRLPGASVSDDGTITINGKTVKKILVDGKEFMTGDTKVAMKNIPTSIVERVKAYNQQSDLTRVTGIDDGEETTVLDFGLRRGMNRGMFGNVDLGLGNHSRYAERFMGAYFNDKQRFMLFANANNVNDQGFPGGGGRGRFGAGRQGLNAAKMLGFNYNFEQKDKLKIDLSGFWNHNNSDILTRSSSENFVSTAGSFQNGISQSYGRTNSFNLQGRLEWQPDSMTNIMFRPTFRWSETDGRSLSSSASFRSDPYLLVSDPLSDDGLSRLVADSMAVNSLQNNSISFSSNNNVSGRLQLNRKLNTTGRNITLTLNGSYGKTDSESLTNNATRLYLMKAASGLDSTYQTNRYNLMPTHSMGYGAQLSYSEPLFRGGYLQFRYSFNYSRNKSDRSTFDFSNLGEDFFAGITPAYRGWSDYLDRLANPLASYHDDDLSRYSEYKNYTNQFDVTFRLIRSKYQLNVGFMVQPQRSKYVQDYQGVHVDTTRSVTNFSPTLDLRYNFSQQHRLRINYRGTTTQPSMTQLLDITDDSNPLNISKGNPGLKPSFTNSLWADYNNFITKSSTFIGGFLSYSSTRNSISDKVTYDETTGGRTTQPENINGNWDVSGRFMFNTPIDTLGRWNINTETSASFANNVGYLTLDRQSDSQKNRTRTFNLGETLGLSYRNEWLEVGVDGSMNYMHARNKLQSQSDLDTWQFAYGGSLTLNTPWGMAVSSDIHQNSRRGYNDNSMNTNELVWNAQISQGFLKGKPLTVMIQFYDILHKQSNFSRAVNAMARTDTWYNSINSYAMVHVTYRFNIFGNRPQRGGGDRGPGFGGRGQGFGGPRGGGRPGSGRPMGPPRGGGRPMM